MAHSPSVAATIAAFLTLFLGSAALGGLLAETFAPGSWIATVVGFFAWPMAFAMSLQAWFGLALLLVVPRVLGLLWRKRSGMPTAASSSSFPPPPGAFVFLPISSATGLLAGFVVGLLSPTHSIWFVTLVYWLVGTAHGALGWQLARVGVLVPPESL
jgi:hypothetical protein